MVSSEIRMLPLSYSSAARDTKYWASPAISSRRSRSGFNDSQVAYWEPSKYAARLRTLKTDARPLLFKVNLEVGHGGASGRFDSLREIAEDDAFLLVELGVDAVART